MPKTKNTTALKYGDSPRLIVVEQAMIQALERQAIAKEQVGNIMENIGPQLRALSNAIGQMNLPLLNAVKAAAETQERFRNIISPFINNINMTIRSSEPSSGYFVMPTTYPRSQPIINNVIDTDEIVEKLLASLENQGKQAQKEIKKIVSSHIEKIIMVRPRNGGQYKIIVNNNYQHYFLVDGSRGAWKLLVEVAEKKMPEAEGQKISMDYLNSNKKCALYTNTSCQITKILKTQSIYIAPAIDLEIITEKGFQQRRNKSSNSA